MVQREQNMVANHRCDLKTMTLSVASADPKRNSHSHFQESLTRTHISAFTLHLLFTQKLTPDSAKHWNSAKIRKLVFEIFFILQKAEAPGIAPWPKNSQSVKGSELSRELLYKKGLLQASLKMSPLSMVMCRWDTAIVKLMSKVDVLKNKHFNKP